MTSTVCGIVRGMADHLTREDVPAAAGTLAVAFSEDPFYRWMTQGAANPTEALRAYFVHKLTHAVGDANALVSPGGNSVLVVERVGKDGDTGPSSLDAVADLLPRDRSPVVREVFAAIDALHPREDHWYVDVIATTPSARGRGDGSRLMVSWLHSPHVASEVVHLQSSNPDNLTFYRRLGFVSAPAVYLPHGAGALTPMTRPDCVTRPQP